MIAFEQIVFSSGVFAFAQSKLAAKIDVGIIRENANNDLII
jgi:hypothetical protein